MAAEWLIDHDQMAPAAGQRALVAAHPLPQVQDVFTWLDGLHPATWILVGGLAPVLVGAPLLLAARVLRQRGPGSDWPMRSSLSPV